MFASINPGQIGIRTLSLRENLALAERHGLGGLDPSLAQLHEEVQRQGADVVRAWFIEHGVQMGTWDLPFMPYAVTEAEWQEGLRQLPVMVAAAAAVGGRRAAMWTFPGSNELSRDANFEHYVARFGPIARLLADHGVRLALEAVGPETALRQFKHPFLRKPAEVLELAHAIGPNVGLVLDSYHWYCAAGTRAELYALPRGSVVHAHVGDARAGRLRAEQMDLERALPGETGLVDLDGFMQALAFHAYDGPVTAEPFDPAVNALGTEQAAARTAKATRGAVARAIFPTLSPTPT